MNVEISRQEWFNQEIEERYCQRFTLEKDIRRIVKICDRELGLENFKIVLASYIPKLKPPAMSLGAGTNKFGVITLEFVDNFLFSNKDVRTDLVAVIAHEYAHRGRIKLLNDKRITLWDAIIWEGTAIQFQRKIFPNLRTLEKLVPIDKVPEILEALRRDKDKVENAERIDEWVYGKGELPWLSLYKAAEVVIGEHVKGKSLTARELLTINPKEVSIPQF